MCDLFDFVNEEGSLDKLDIPVSRVPVNMRIRDDEACSSFFVLQQTNNGNVVFAQYAIEHVICLLEVLSLHRNGTEFDELLLHQLVSMKLW